MRYSLSLQSSAELVVKKRTVFSAGKIVFLCTLFKGTLPFYYLKNRKEIQTSLKFTDPALPNEKRK